MKKKKDKKKKVRDEVMLLHLTKTFNCGPHDSKKDYGRTKDKAQLKKELEEENS
jgi:hypothetical protein